MSSPYGFILPSSSLNNEDGWTTEEQEELLNEELLENEYFSESVKFEPLQVCQSFEHVTPYLTSSTLVKFPDKDILCMFGGVHLTSRKATNEVWLYDLKKKVWERIRFNMKPEKIVRLEKRVQYTSQRENKIMSLTPTLRGCEPTPRCGHCAIALSPKEMLIFGGHDLQNQRLLNDCWILRIENAKTWKLVVPDGRVPIPRWYASCVKYRDRIYVFGGETDKFRLLNDVCIFSIPDEGWLDVRTIYPTPAPRMLHSTTVINGKMYIIGGLGKKNDRETCDIWEFDLTILKWREIIPRSKITPFACYEDKDKKNKKKERHGNYDFLDIDGERNGSGKLGNVDTDEFYVDEEIESSESDGEVFIEFGDNEFRDSFKNMNNSKNEIIELNKRSGIRRSGKKLIRPIYGHCSIPWGNRIIVYGGKRNHKLIDEVWIFNLNSEKWTKFFPSKKNRNLLGNDAKSNKFTNSLNPNVKNEILSYRLIPPKRWKMMHSFDSKISQEFEVSEKIQEKSESSKKVYSQSDKKNSQTNKKSGSRKKSGNVKKKQEKKK